MGVVSIIVPVYNVSEYLDRCLESLIGQTYRDLEIIVVDDGSTDGSETKCDDWAQSDGRIKVVHQRNKGLSGARNTGLDSANGEYILFVDSDDFVDSKYVELLYKKATDTASDIAICNYSFVNDIGQQIDNNNYTSYTSDAYMDGADMLLLFENKSYKTFFDVVWNKLFKRELFDGVRFPEGVSVVEDIAVMPILYHGAKRVSVIPDKLYYYVYREESLSHTKRSEQEDLDIRIPMMEDRLVHYLEWGIKEISLLHITHMYSMYRRRIGDYNDRLHELQREFRNIYFKGNYTKGISFSRRIKFALGAVSLRLYDRIVALR